nr:PREDICTED: uncharacterized protein C16orf95 homolog [Rhinolophus sinicus]
MMCPAPSAIHGEPMCCECQARFRGHLPMPRTEAALPYWVPQSLRPQKKIQKRIRLCIPRVIKACPCTCHCFGGRLPVPRDRAMMPYWVPQVLRSHHKMARRQQSFTGIQGNSAYTCLIPSVSPGRQGLMPIMMGMGRLLSSQTPWLSVHTLGTVTNLARTLGFPPWVLEGSLVCSTQTQDKPVPRPGLGLTRFLRLETSWDSSACYNCWRICDRRLLFKWQQLQPRHQERRLALGSGVSPQVLLLPLSLLTLLQAILRVMAVIR